MRLRLFVLLFFISFLFFAHSVYAQDRRFFAWSDDPRDRL